MRRPSTVWKFIKAEPLGVLSLGMALSLMFAPVFGVLVWNMFQTLTVIGTTEMRLQRLVGNLAHLDEVATMCARMAAVTGDPRWEARHREVEPELDNAILEAAMLSRQEYDKYYAAQTKLAYSKLLEIESVAFALTRQGRLQEASQLIFGPDYENQKTLFSKHIQLLAGAVEHRVHDDVELTRVRLLHAGVVGVASLCVVVVGWLAVSIVLKRHLRMRRAAEAALISEREQLTVTLRSIGDGVIATNKAGAVTMMNHVAETLTGWTSEEALGRPLEEVFFIINQETRKRAENPVPKVLLTGAVCGLANNTILVARDSTERIIADSGSPIREPGGAVIGVVLVFRDVTEEYRLQNEAVKAEKLESIGILAGGMAHDFNNILAGIMGNISIAKMTLEDPGKVTARLLEAEHALIRAKALTKQILVFSKGGVPIRRTASLKELLPDWAAFALRGSNVQCRCQVEQCLWLVDIDEGQISQVFHNLLINANQAMPDGGTVSIEASNCIETGENRLPLEPGRYVRISVRDQGIGIAPSHLKKIFDPYFTTKVKGTGLGLATSHATVNRHGGHITVESKVGQGTAFQVFLPASASSAECKRQEPGRISEGRGKILLMDDEPIVRDMAGEMLALLGYDVVVSRDGQEAVGLYESALLSDDPFDAVVMDLTVPGAMGGIEAVARLRAVDPEVRAIVSSGYCNDPAMGEFEKYGFSGVLAKPYTTAQMCTVLDSVLRGAGCDDMSEKLAS